MKLTELSDEQLRKFISTYCDELRVIFAQDKNLAKRIPGFRPSHADNVPTALIERTALNQIKNSNRMLIKILEDLYNGLKHDIEVKYNELLKENYGRTLTYAIALSEKFTADKLDIFFDIEGFTKEDSEEITKYFNVVNFISNAQKDKNNEFKETLKKLVSMDDFSNLKQKITLLIDGTSANIKKELFAELDKKTSNLPKKEDITGKNFAEKDTVDNKFAKLDASLNDNIKEVKDCANKFKELQDKVEYLEQKVDELSNLAYEKPIESKSFSIEFIENTEYDILDDEDTLDTSIYDVTCDATDNDAAKKLLVKYLKQVIYADKPILVPKNISIAFTKLLSYVMTGGNYYIVDIKGDINIDDLFNELKEKIGDQQNDVILVRYAFNQIYLRPFLDKIKNNKYFMKFIFEMDSEKEIMFRPIQDLNDFIFFKGKLLSDKLKYPFMCNYRKSNLFTLDDLNKALKDLEVEDIKPQQYSRADASGLLAFSYLPFLALNKRTDIHDLISDLEDDKLKCELNKIW